jgi:putative tricarboxylic transport membrane protein
MLLTRHSMEMATAAAIAAFGGAMVAGSLQLSVGWAATGPQSGYFPFRLGLLLCGVSALLFVQAALGARDGTAFATREQLLRSLSIFGPTLLLVLAMPWVGCYGATAVYLLYMARAHGGFGWLRASAVALATALALYLVFELWFQVPLAKGPIEAWLGLSA